MVAELAVVALEDAVVTLEDAVVALEDAVVALVGVTVTLEVGVAVTLAAVTLVGEETVGASVAVAIAASPQRQNATERTASGKVNVVSVRPMVAMR